MWRVDQLASVGNASRQTAPTRPRIEGRRRQRDRKLENRCQDLYEQLVAPFGEFASGSTLVIHATGALRGLPFDFLDLSKAHHSCPHIPSSISQHSQRRKWRPLSLHDPTLLARRSL